MSRSSHCLSRHDRESVYRDAHFLIQRTEVVLVSKNQEELARHLLHHFCNLQSIALHLGAEFLYILLTLGRIVMVCHEPLVRSHEDSHCKQRPILIAYAKSMNQRSNLIIILHDQSTPQSTIVHTGLFAQFLVESVVQNN